jgi:hypothetical protein
VSFLKAPAYQDGHAGYSDPLDEQQFVVSTINRLQAFKDWADTAVLIAAGPHGRSPSSCTTTRGFRLRSTQLRGDPAGDRRGLHLTLLTR